MHISEIASEAPSAVPGAAPEAPQEPIAEISATLLRAQAFLSGCGIALLVREGEWLVSRASNGAAAPDIGARIAVEHTFLGLCVSLKKPQSCEDSDCDIRVENLNYSRLRPKSILAVPVRAGQDVIAVLASFSSAPNAFTNTQIAILRTVADSLSRPVRQLPQSAPPPAEVPAAQPEPWAASSQERATKSEPIPAAPAAPPVPPAKPAEQAPAPPEEPAYAAPVIPLLRDEVLALADEPAAPLPAPEPRLSARPARLTTYPIPVPRSFELPSRRRSRRIRRTVIRIAGVTGACLLCALATAGWYSTRVAKAPLFSATPSAPPMVEARALAAAPAEPHPVPAASEAEERVAPAPAPVAAPEPKPRPAVAAKAEVQVAKKPAAAPALTAPLPSKEHAAAPAVAEPAIAAPVLAMNTAPALPALVAPHAEAPKIQQSVATPARLERRVAPEYPMAALKRRIAGDVTLSLLVRKDGTVANIKQVGGNPLFRDSAIDAVKRWRYSPAILDGKPVEATAQVVLKFELPPESR